MQAPFIPGQSPQSAFRWVSRGEFLPITCLLVLVSVHLSMVCVRSGLFRLCG